MFRYVLDVFDCWFFFADIQLCGSNCCKSRVAEWSCMLIRNMHIPVEFQNSVDCTFLLSFQNVCISLSVSKAVHHRRCFNLLQILTKMLVHWLLGATIYYRCLVSETENRARCLSWSSRFRTTWEERASIMKTKSTPIKSTYNQLNIFFFFAKDHNQLNINRKYYRPRWSTG
jgi:hypothetical protein